MANLPDIFEKKWPTVILTPITIANHLVTVSSTSGLHTKQTVELSKIGLETKEFEIKRVESDTTIRVGPKDSGKMSEYANPTEFHGGTLTMSEQNRNPIASEYVLRAVYLEEPAVALRTIAVDEFGEHIDSLKDSYGINRLAVDIGSANINADIAWPTVPYIYNVPVPTAATEVSQALPASTQQFSVKVRDGAAQLQLAFVPTQSGTNFIKVSRGSSYSSSEVDLTGKTIYAQCDKPGVVLEIIAWALL